MMRSKKKESHLHEMHATKSGRVMRGRFHDVIIEIVIHGRMMLMGITTGKNGVPSGVWALKVGCTRSYVHVGMLVHSINNLTASKMKTHRRCSTSLPLTLSFSSIPARCVSYCRSFLLCCLDK